MTDKELLELPSIASRFQRLEKSIARQPDKDAKKNLAMVRDLITVKSYAITNSKKVKFLRFLKVFLGGFIVFSGLFLVLQVLMVPLVAFISWCGLNWMPFLIVCNITFAYLVITKSIPYVTKLYDLAEEKMILDMFDEYLMPVKK